MDKKIVCYLLDAEDFNTLRLGISMLCERDGGMSDMAWEARRKLHQTNSELMRRAVPVTDEEARRMLPSFYGNGGNAPVHIPSQAALREIRNLVADLNHMSESDEARARTAAILGYLDGDEPGGEGVRTYERIPGEVETTGFYGNKLGIAYVPETSVGVPGGTPLRADETIQPVRPRYVVDGMTAEGGAEGPGIWETDPKEGKYPPFRVFDVDQQEFVPGDFPSREDASVFAEALNDRNAWALRRQSDDDRTLDRKTTYLSSNEEEFLARMLQSTSDNAKLTYCAAAYEGDVRKRFEAAIIRFIVESRRS
jgi:hypothetical protein